MSNVRCQMSSILGNILTDAFFERERYHRLNEPYPAKTKCFWNGHSVIETTSPLCFVTSYLVRQAKLTSMKNKINPILILITSC